MKIKRNKLTEGTIELGKKASIVFVHAAGKTKEYSTGIGKLIIKDVKKLGCGISKAIRSKVEINIILPEERETKDVDVEVIKS